MTLIRRTEDAVLTIRRDGWKRYALVWFIRSTGTVVPACAVVFPRSRDAVTFGLKAGFGCAVRITLPKG